jgi:hypothetical protein
LEQQQTLDSILQLIARAHIQEHGSAALEIAHERALAFHQLGDLDNEALWHRIAILLKRESHPDTPTAI